MGATTVGRVSQCQPRFCAPYERPSVVSGDCAALAPREPLRTKGLRRLMSKLCFRYVFAKLCFRYVFANNPLLCDPHNLSPQDITETLETERAPTPKGRGSDRWVARGLRGRSAGLPLPATLPTRPPWCPPSRRP